MSGGRFRTIGSLLPFALVPLLLVKIMAGGRSVKAADGNTVLRGIRGATTVTEDTASAILEATEDLVREIVAANGLRSQDVAARRMGWTMVPLLNFTEIGVPGRLERCVRVLVHVNTAHTQDEMVHVYLREAVSLRPDLAGMRPTSHTQQPVARSTTPQ